MRTIEIGNKSMLNNLIALPREKKIEIIAYLSNSLLEETEPTTPDLYTCFKGDWGEGEDSVEYCNKLRTEGLAPDKEVLTW